MFLWAVRIRGTQFNSREPSGFAIDREMFTSSVDAGFVLALPFDHRDIEPDCVRALMRGAYARAAMNDTPATLRKHPASSPFNSEARQPTTSIGSISPPRVLRIHRTAEHFSIEGGHNREKMLHPTYKPTLRFVLRLRLQKGDVFAGNYGTITGITTFHFLHII